MGLWLVICLYAVFFFREGELRKGITLNQSSVVSDSLRPHELLNSFLPLNISIINTRLLILFGLPVFQFCIIYMILC